MGRARTDPQGQTATPLETIGVSYEQLRDTIDALCHAGNTTNTQLTPGTRPTHTLRGKNTNTQNDIVYNAQNNAEMNIKTTHNMKNHNVHVKFERTLRIAH